MSFSANAWIVIVGHGRVTWSIVDGKLNMKATRWTTNRMARYGALLDVRAGSEIVTSDRYSTSNRNTILPSVHTLDPNRSRHFYSQRMQGAILAMRWLSECCV